MPQSSEDGYCPLLSNHQEFKSVVRANAGSALQLHFILNRRQKFTELITRLLG